MSMKKAAALRYNSDKERAPKVVAKGKGEVAKNIIKIAVAISLKRYFGSRSNLKRINQHYEKTITSIVNFKNVLPF